MNYYYLILVWIAAVYIITVTVNLQKTEYVCGKRVHRYQLIWAFLIFLPLIIWSGYRGYIGDTYAYKLAFDEMPVNFSDIPEYMETVTKDKGFYFLSAVIKSVIGADCSKYFIIIAFLQAIPIILIYRKYSSDYLTSFFLFVASTDYISWMFNGARQFVAVAITFACFELILQKKYVPTIIIILIASLFHGSALLLLPFVFIAQGKAWNKNTIIFIIGVVIAVSFVDKFTNVLDGLLAETQYKNVVSDWGNWQDDGTNILRVLVYSVPALLSFIGKKYIESDNDQVINLCTNMSIVSAGFYVISMFTSGIFIGRLPIYFSLYGYILLPYMIGRFFNKDSARIVNLVMIVAYLFFYYYQIHFAWGLV